MTLLQLMPFPRSVPTIAATTLATTLSLTALPAQATDRGVVACPRTVSDSYATLIFDVDQIEVHTDMGEEDDVLELVFALNVRVQPVGAGSNAVAACSARVAWRHPVPELAIAYGGLMRYPMGDRVLVTNVPRNSVVTLSLMALEDDDFTAENLDLSPFPVSSDLVLTLSPANGNGQTELAQGTGTRDITFGLRKRVEGDGLPRLMRHSRSAIEFTVSLSAEAAPSGGIAGAVGPGGTTTPPQVGGAIPTPDTRDPGLPGPGQSVGASRSVRCTEYANEARRQFRDQAALNCNFAPPVWSDDFNLHFNWCMQGNNIDQIDAGWLMREAGLAVCRQNRP